jgi:hypothetical protein
MADSAAKWPLSSGQSGRKEGPKWPLPLKIENENVVVEKQGGSPRPADAPATTTSSEDLITKLKERFPLHDVAAEFGEHCKFQKKRGRPITPQSFGKWMGRAHIPLKISKKSLRSNAAAPEPNCPDDPDDPGAQRIRDELKARKEKKFTGTPQTS